MVDVLLLCYELPAAQVELAVRGALAAGALDGRAVQVLACRAQRAQPTPLTGLDDRLQAVDRPSSDRGGYDQLLKQGRRR